MSVGTARWVNVRDGGVKKSDEMPTEDETEGHLDDRESLFNHGKTQVIRIQRDLG